MVSLSLFVKELMEEEKYGEEFVSRVEGRVSMVRIYTLHCLRSPQLNYVCTMPDA
jgi:hypothetical protein